VFAADLRPSRTRFALAIGAAVAAFLLLASPPALAQLSFKNPTSFSLSGTSARAIVASDFNGDGHLDVATANQGYFQSPPGGAEVLLGDGNGGLTDKKQYAAGGQPISLDIGQFNADAYIDLAVANHDSGDVSVLLGAGDGSFGAPTNYAVGGGCADSDRIFPEAVVVGFFNSDRHADLAVANFGCSNISILLGRGDGSFSGPTSVGVNEAPDSLATGDFNADENLDLVVAYGADNTGLASVLLGRGDGSFSSSTTVATGGQGASFVEVAVGDFDGDSSSDLAFADQSFFSGLVAIVLGRGDGSFGDPTGTPINGPTTSVAVGDFNADTVQDVVTTDYQTPAVWVLPGAGDGTFGTPLSFQGGDPQAVTVGYFNADPLPDMATADPNPAKVSVLLNTTPLPSRTRTVGVVPGGSCAPGGGRGTVGLALARSARRARGLALSVTSSNHRLVPTRRMIRKGNGAHRALTLRPVAGRRGAAVVTVNRLRQGQLTGSARIRVRVGGKRADRLLGSRRADVVLGKKGSDRLAGRGGNDLLCGGQGADLMRGGRGGDQLRGGAGPDSLYGGRGPDWLAPGAGDDRINSRGGGRDRVLCGDGSDTVIADQRERLRGCERVVR
jgi:hypothetical protein